MLKMTSATTIPNAGVRGRKVYAYLSVAGFSSDPSAISSSLALLPTASWKQGDEGPYGPRNFSAWRLYSRCENERSIGAHICDLLAQLQGREAAVVALARECRITMQCVAHMGSGCPSLSIEPLTLQTLAAINVEFDVDLYLD